jgi:hypothetical protein
MFETKRRSKKEMCVCVVEGGLEFFFLFFSLLFLPWKGQPSLKIKKENFDMGLLEKIKDIELEISRTQKNKATEHHLGLLKAKLAKFRAQLLEPPKSSKGAGEGFDVARYGDGRVAMIGFPSVGKSTLLTKLTETQSAIAAYEFTTLTVVPGIIKVTALASAFHSLLLSLERELQETVN